MARKVTDVEASRRASCEWQYSADGGKTWGSAPATLRGVELGQATVVAEGGRAGQGIEMS